MNVTVCLGLAAAAAVNHMQNVNKFIINEEDLEPDILENIVKMICSETIPKCKDFYEEIIPSFNFSCFKSNFRVTPTAFELILNEIAHVPEYQKRNRTLGGKDQIHIEKALLICIWTLATPESYRSIGCRFHVSKSSVFICVHTIVKIIINHLCRRFIIWPAVHERHAVSMEFGKYNMVNVLGAIDGCHIPIKKPKFHGEDYYNRKKFYSVVLQGICKANFTFIDVDVRWPGSVHDARVFRTSDIYPLGQQLCAPNFYIIGDAAYPCISWLIPPVINNGHLTGPQRYFNTQLSKTRVSIEHSFALLLGRFRRIKNMLDMDNLQNIMNTIIACCTLHNICILQGEDEDLQQYMQEGQRNLVMVNLEHAQGLNNNDRNGAHIRNHLITDLWNRRNVMH